jgi:alpha-L-fucosidase 2
LDSFVEDTLWTGTPGNYTNPHAPEALSVVRKLVDNGQYADATTAAEKLSHDPSDVCIILMHNLPLHFINESLQYNACWFATTCGV